MVDFNEWPDIMRVAGELADQIAGELRAQRPEIMGLNSMSEEEANVAIANALMISSAVVFEGIYDLPIGDLGLEFNEVVRKAVRQPVSPVKPTIATAPRDRLLQISSQLDQILAEADNIAASPVYDDVEKRAEDLSEKIIDLQVKVEQKLAAIGEFSH